MSVDLYIKNIKTIVHRTTSCSPSTFTYLYYLSASLSFSNTSSSNFQRSSLLRKPLLVASKQLCGSSSQSQKYDFYDAQNGHFSFSFILCILVSQLLRQEKQVKFTHSLQPKIPKYDLYYLCSKECRWGSNRLLFCFSFSIHRSQLRNH